MIVEVCVRHPTVPWSKPVEVFRAPPEADSHRFSYAGKAHAALSQEEGELILTYVVNSGEFDDVLSDASVYHPRFVRARVRVSRRGMERRRPL